MPEKSGSAGARPSTRTNDIASAGADGNAASYRADVDTLVPKIRAAGAEIIFSTIPPSRHRLGQQHRRMEPLADDIRPQQRREPL
jgi:hypothetical protein